MKKKYIDIMRNKIVRIGQPIITSIGQGKIIDVFSGSVDFIIVNTKEFYRMTGLPIFEYKE